MTTSDAPTGTTPVRYRLPDPPEREYDEVTAQRYVYIPGAPPNLALHYGLPETLLQAGDEWIAASPGSRPLLRPDLLIAFDVDPDLYWEQNGYVISDQGKPPDFVLEVASKSTAERDVGYKRVEYAAMGIPEYWRFDHTGDWHGAKLAGDRLVGTQYEPIPIVEVEAGVFEGSSEVLNLTLRWKDSELFWVDPATGQPIPGVADERAARLEAEARAGLAEARARLAEARAEALEAELRRLRQLRD